MHHLFVIGTRPEVIKCSSVILRLQSLGDDVSIVTTGQHADLVQPLMRFFGLEAHYHLYIDHCGDHDELLVTIQQRLRPILVDLPVDLVWVQGDTTTALAGGLVAASLGYPLAHIEAGLRSFQSDPYPEEFNRVRLGQLAQFHFCPTNLQADHLRREGVQSGIFVTGNTVIDALLLTQKQLLKQPLVVPNVPTSFALMTCHRREWTAKTFSSLCQAIQSVYSQYPNDHLVFPVHPNPAIHEVAYSQLEEVPNIHLLPPCDYPHFVQLMMRCLFILTDSGGIQEEAPSLNKPVFILRNNTERPELLACGAGEQWGMDPEVIMLRLQAVLSDPTLLMSMMGKQNPFGSGDAAEKIVSGIMEAFRSKI